MIRNMFLETENQDQLELLPFPESTRLKFPAGLLDEGETSIQCALRELQEETGYKGKLPAKQIQSIYPTIPITPWKSDDLGNIICVNVDLQDEENLNPKQELEQIEQIQILFVDDDETLMKQLSLLKQEKDCEIDGKLWTYALGKM